MQKQKKSPAEQQREQRNKRAIRIARKKEERKAARRQPYSDDTLLAHLVRPEHHPRLRDMLKELKPYLMNGEEVRRSPCLVFDLTKLEGQRMAVYNAIAQFLFGDKEKKVLKVSLAAFARYLTDNCHSNLSVKCNALLTKIQESRKLLDLT